jgi:DNA-binding protein Fis
MSGKKGETTTAATLLGIKPRPLKTQTHYQLRYLTDLEGAFSHNTYNITVRKVGNSIL